MKPAPFAYVKAATLDHVLELLVRHGDEARILAGGQSLIPTLNLRLAAPALLIDINGLNGLAGISAEDGAVRIGALTRQGTIERSDRVARHCPLLAKALPYVAHPAVRNRGTLGGSLALADPAAELPACAVALGAQIELRGPAGARTVEAETFFRGLYETDLRADEVVTAMCVPPPAPDQRCAFLELARRHGDYAMAGLAARARARDGVLGDVRLVFFGIGAKPTLARATAAALERGETELRDALAADLEPLADLQADAATKLHLAGVLARRAARELAGAPH